MITPSFGLTATERVLPRMALDFTTASLDPRVTFTRTGNTATVTNSSGNVVPINADLPRFDFDPITLVCKGLLIEESRTNVIFFSEDFANGNWIKVDTTGTNDVVNSPEGVLNSSKLTEGVGAGAHYTIQAVTVTPLVDYTFSVFFKAAGRNFAQIQFGNATNSGVGINLTTGVATPFNGATNFSVQGYANGWWRLTLTAQFAVSAGGILLLINDTLNNQGYQGDGVSGVYLWGAQMEAGSFPTSYIPTDVSQFTRNADVATMTGTNFSSWYNANGGSLTMLFQGVKQQPANFTRLFVLYTDASNYLQDVIFSGGLSSFPEMVTAGVSQLDFMTITVADTFNMGVVFATNDFKFAGNAGGVGIDTTVTIPPLASLYIGCDQSGASQINGYVKKVAYYLPAFTTSEIQAFTK